LKEKPLAAYYDEILLGGLRLAEADVQRGLIDEERLQRVRDVVAEIMEDLATHRDASEPNDNSAESDSPLAQLEKVEVEVRQQALPNRWREGTPVLCIPGPSLLDEAVAKVVAHTVERKGVGARAETCDALSLSRFLSWETDGVELVCLCYMAHATPA